MGSFLTPKMTPFFRAQKLTPLQIRLKILSDRIFNFSLFRDFKRGNKFPILNSGVFCRWRPPHGKNDPRKPKKGGFWPPFGTRKGRKKPLFGLFWGSVFGPTLNFGRFLVLFWTKNDHFRAKNDPQKGPILTPFFDPFFGAFFGTKKGVKKWGLF